MTKLSLGLSNHLNAVGINLLLGADEMIRDLVVACRGKTVLCYNCTYRGALLLAADKKLLSLARDHLCTGPSMEPTLYSNDILFTEHITPRLQKVKRGDIIIAKCPSNPHINICKRVLGTPGDKIMVGYSTHVVPRGHVWLQGDNAGNSTDSRVYGPVPQGLIRGRALCRLWPPQDMKMLTYKGKQTVTR